MALLALAAQSTRAQIMYGSGVSRQELGASAIGMHFGLEDIRPELHKWYAPRHLPRPYETSWHLSGARYGGETYQRYVDAELEGPLWHDRFGHDIGRGWLLYDWNQVQEHAKGSSIWKGMRYSGLFRRLVVASEEGSAGGFRLMVGDEIHTTFTPLTFSKPRFDGLRLDGAGERWKGSVILSRPSWPDVDNVMGTLRPSERANYTNLLGGHVELQVAPAALVGLTYVNAHLGNTKEKFGSGSPFSGSLSTDQNQPIQTLWVRVRDDSPADDRGGALLFDYDIVLTDTSGRELRGREIDFLPTVEGGLARGSALAADGSETVLLSWDLAALSYDDVETADLRKVLVELSVGDDYRVEVTSDRQNDGELRRAAPVFLTYERAPGNARDNSNAQILEVEYGLPTATEVMGVNWDLVDWGGLSIQGELAMSRRHRQYPNPGITRRHRMVAQDAAAYVQARWQRTHWEIFSEAFCVADGYSTTAWLVGSDGKIKYKDPTVALYEFVDDDDDYNGIPEWHRRGQAWADVAWPGYDTNTDFLHDHNQNSNLIPDYEEPFLRFRSDRPAFLPGLDMNYNGVIDRLENDAHPDYPYRRDQGGHNTYLTLHVGPQLNLLAGGQQMGLGSSDARTRAVYGSARWEANLSGRSRLRVYEHAALVHDDILDPVRQWAQPFGLDGKMRDVVDPLAFRNTWMHSLYANLTHELGPGLRFEHRGRWKRLWQRDESDLVRGREGRSNSGFLGLIDRVEWHIPVGQAALEPRWKSEYRRQRPYSRRQPAGESLEETLFLLWTQPLLGERITVGYFPRYGRQLFSTTWQVGLETSWFRMLDGAYEEAEEDYSSWTVVSQLTNRSAYQGYQVVSRIGLQLRRRRYEGVQVEKRNMFFATLHVGLK